MAAPSGSLRRRKNGFRRKIEVQSTEIPYAPTILAPMGRDAVTFLVVLDFTDGIAPNCPPSCRALSPTHERRGVTTR